MRGLVEMHGGSVHALSGGIGRGSEFVVRLPAIVGFSKRPDDDACGGGTPHAPSKFRILVVDDNRDSAISLAMMLRIMGHDTRTAHDGFEALDVAAAFEPEVVLLDIGLPRLDGYGVCRRLREQPAGRSVVVIALSGWGQEEDKRRSKDAGFNFHLVKPVEPASLGKLLSGLLVPPG